MVWDEMVAFWLVLWLTPAGWLPQAVAFVLFRAFDIVKPPPIKFFDARLKGGFGVMWDDIVAAGYALLIMALAVRTESSHELAISRPFVRPAGRAGAGHYPGPVGTAGRCAAAPRLDAGLG